MTDFEPEYGAATTTQTSTQLAADKSLFPLWDPSAPLPPAEEMLDLDVVTHVAVERGRPDGFHFLHESAIAWHRGRLHLCWTNHRLYESNETDELIRGSTSTDGITWAPAQTWIAPPTDGGESFNHPVLATCRDRLWGFFTRWVDRKPSAVPYLLDDQKQTWTAAGDRLTGFLPLRPPMKLASGNWVMSGEFGWNEPAVALSAGDDWTRWDIVTIPRPAEMTLRFPETTLIDQGNRLIAVCRPFKLATAPVSVSTDGGRSWEPLRLSNYPLGPSQPYAGTLSTGQHYLITNHLEHSRTLLSIAVTSPGSRLFSRIWKIRHQAYPKRRLFGGIAALGDKIKSYVGKPTEWSYPAVVEHEGKLFISYTQGKEDCVLSIVPVAALA